MNGIDILKRYSINVHKNSKQTVTEFENYTWAKDKNGEPLNKPIDRFNHSIDAIRYAVSEKIGMPQITQDALNDLNSLVDELDTTMI